MTNLTIEVLHAARRIANYAKEKGVLLEDKNPRVVCEHLGAVLADSVLQSGLNYSTVVLPRVLAILQAHPDRCSISSLVSLIQEGKTGVFLNWNHRVKIHRFNALVFFLQERGIEDVHDLRTALASDEFSNAIQTVSGIGPKTVDYMSCLIGSDSIAIDRHVRTFAKAAGVDNNDYQFLRASFCCAADLLSLPRREFDAWLWHKATLLTQKQLALAV